jgi:ferredoxin-like protein FixX
MGEQIPVPESFISVDQERCTGCGSCITICGGQVFKMKDDKAAVLYIERCLECWCCEVVCSAEAIHIQVPAAGTGIMHTCG